MGNIDSLIDEVPEIESEIYNPKNSFTAETHRPLTSGMWDLFGHGLVRKSIYFDAQFTPKYAALSEPPIPKSLQFDCPNCYKKCFDGGLCKKVYCDCGVCYKRNEDDAIQIIKDQPLLRNEFKNNFIEINSKPNAKFIPQLVSITLGMFREGIPMEFMIGGRSNFPTIFNYYLAPYFKARLRCLGIGDYFAYGDAKFKVLGCFPSFGVVTEETVIRCSDVLVMHSIERVQILPIWPSVLNEAVFRNTLQPVLRKKPRHLHIGDYLYINSMEFIVTAGQPIDGLISQNTQFYFGNDSLQPLQRVSLIPFLEDLSFHYHTLKRDELIEEIICDFIMPYVQGMRRVVYQGQVITIDGVGFLVVDAWPTRGVIFDNTQIKYDGSLARRYIGEPPQIMFSGGSLYVRRNHMWEDPMEILARHIMSLNQSMAAIGGPQTQSAPEEIIQSLPVKVLSSIPEDAEASKCMVCLEPYAIGEIVKTLPCFHMFHTNCIDEWLHRSCLCPLCKTSVVFSE